MTSKSGPILFATVLGVVMLSSACATKKFVRNMVHPLEAHLSKVDAKTADNAGQIRDVDARSERGIAQAQQSADAAAQSAKTADQHAVQAQSSAVKAQDSALTAQQMADNVDNYQSAHKATVLFAFNSSRLRDQDKEELDQIAQTVGSMKHYVIQVQGFTDSTGPSRYNLELSRRRADAVVRYLSSDCNIPLVRIYKLGYGEGSPAAPNRTRAGREENRRVEVTVLEARIPVPVKAAHSASMASSSVSQ